MNRVFVIADLHFGHVLVSGLRGFQTTQEHDDTLVKNWNLLVSKKDTVYVLGDVFRLDRVLELNGIKKLALGNHDTKTLDKYLPLFSKVAAYFQYNDCILSHIPIHEGQLVRRWKLNVHGHTHEYPLKDRRYVCTSAEQLNFKPVLLNDLIDRRLKELKL